MEVDVAKQSLSDFTLIDSHRFKKNKKVFSEPTILLFTY